MTHTDEAGNGGYRMLTKEQVDALPGLIAEATQGPWDRDGDSIIECSDHLDICHVVWRDKGNARLIALAPTLAATVIEQQAEIERLRGALSQIATMTNLDDPDSYASDTPSDCVESVHQVANFALKGGDA